MCNECEFFCLDSNEDVCLSLVSVVSSLVVASCGSARCDENLFEEGFDVDVSVRNQFSLFTKFLQTHFSAWILARVEWLENK